MILAVLIVEVGLITTFSTAEPGGRHDARGHPIVVADGCAHRHAPLGTRIRVRIVGTLRRATCVVVDRGPWGAMRAGRWMGPRAPGHGCFRPWSGPWGWLTPRRACLGPHERYKGVLDVLPAVSRRLGLHGWLRARLLYEIGD